MSEDLGLSIARSLTRIVVLWRDLEDEAEHRFADKDIPGGDALVMLGPVANMEAYNYRQLSEMMGRTNAKGGEDDADTDVAPPLLVMASWHDILRQERGLPDSTKRATITGEADGIRTSIDWMLAEDENGTPNFMPADELDRDLKRVVARLERILKAGEQRDKGVPCMNCGGDLVKDWGPDKDGKDDRWNCRPCNRWSTIEQYNLAVTADHIAHADKLTAANAAIRLNVTASRIRVWGSRYPELKAGRDDKGLWLYRVSELQERVDAEALAG